MSSNKVHFYTWRGPNICTFPQISSSLIFRLHSIGSCCQQFTCLTLWIVFISYLGSSIRFLQLQSNLLENYTTKGKWNDYGSQPLSSTLLYMIDDLSTACYPGSYRSCYPFPFLLRMASPQPWALHRLLHRRLQTKTTLAFNSSSDTFKI